MDETDNGAEWTGYRYMNKLITVFVGGQELRVPRRMMRTLIVCGGA